MNSVFSPFLLSSNPFLLEKILLGILIGSQFRGQLYDKPFVFSSLAASKPPSTLKINVEGRFRTTIVFSGWPPNWRSAPSGHPPHLRTV
jgi:hypothetical protein